MGSYVEPAILMSYSKEELESSLLPYGEKGVHGDGLDGGCGCGCGCGCS